MEDVFFGAMTTPTPVTLASFITERFADGVTLRWATATELGVTGFRIWCGASDDVAQAQLVSAIIPTNSDGLTETGYAWTDAGADGAGFYWLEVLNADGTPERYGPVRVPTTPAAGTTQLFLPLVGQ